MEYLQVILKEFNPTTTSNENTRIHYFLEGLRPSIQVQLDNRGQDLDVWDKVVEKAIDVEVKVSLQSPSKIREINFRCPRDYRPSVKKDKHDANWEH